jgi:5-methylthioadenosine/S-adenosylhomocysteine deaminase
MAFLITGGVVVTMDPNRTILPDGAVAVEKDRIIDIGLARELDAKYKAAERIDAKNNIILPGLIDTHGHAGHGMIKTIAESNEKWNEIIYDVYVRGTSKRFWYAEARLSAVERIKFGTTCGVSLLGGGAGAFRCDNPEFAVGYAEALAEVGIRGIIGLGPSGRRLPYKSETFRTWNHGLPTDQEVSFEQSLEVTRKAAFQVNTRYGKRIILKASVNSIAPNPSNLSEEEKSTAASQAHSFRELAEEIGTGVVAHASGGTIEYADQLGMLGRNVVLAHCAGLTEQEIRVLRKTGTSVAHCPRARSIMSVRCPVPELLNEGVNVALGSDGNAPDRSFNMFDDMRTAMTIHRTYFHDDRIMPPGKVLEMATVDAAKALGLLDSIGSLEKGKKADIIIIDAFKPHLVPLVMVPQQLVYSASGFDVQTVMIDGEVVMKDRMMTKVAEEKVLEQAQQEAKEVMERTSLKDLTGLPEGFWKSTRYG